VGVFLINYNLETSFTVLHKQVYNICW